MRGGRSVKTFLYSQCRAKMWKEATPTSLSYGFQQETDADCVSRAMKFIHAALASEGLVG